MRPGLAPSSTHSPQTSLQAAGNTGGPKSVVGQDFILRPIFNRPPGRRLPQRFVAPETFPQGIDSRSCRRLWIARVPSAGRSDRRSLARHFLTPQTSRRASGGGRASQWRTHSCVPRRHSWRRLRILGSQRQRQECRCGTHECVPHFGSRVFETVCGRFVESAGTPRMNACAIEIHDHPIGQGRRSVAPEKVAPEIVSRSSGN